MSGSFYFYPAMNRDLRIVFMGTPTFAVPALQYLMEAGYAIVGVITAPDKPGGRGLQQMISSPIKAFALQHQLPLLQPVNLKSAKFLEQLKSLNADLQVVVAFRMLPEIVWNMPSKGTMNLHGSLLPAYRGAAPIHHAVINGDRVTGVTTFMLEHEIDSGKILLQREIPILPEDDTGSLHDRMMHIGAGLVVASVDAICNGTAHPVPQDLSKVSHAPKIHQEDARIHWDRGADEIINLIRGMSPYPAAWSQLDGVILKVWKARKYSSQQHHPVGTISTPGPQLILQAGDGEVELTEIQLAGKKRMSAKEFLNGYRIKTPILT
jgi:methionyl-tRNA formyltransferase